MKVKDTLQARNSQYGSYESGIKSRSIILDVLKKQYKLVNSIEMPVEQEVWLMDLINKLARLSVNPSHIDSIHDLVGYSTLIEKILIEKYKDEI